jgi:transcriptional regulator with XRE-family HTH domain
MESKLKSIREAKGLSQGKTAERCGISPIMYQSMEQGRRKGSFWTWKKIQDVLEIPDEKMWDVIRDLTIR